MGTGRELVDLTDREFGYLRVVRLSRKVKAPGHKTTTYILWMCECVCGARVEVTGANLRSGQKSCGCMKGKLISKAMMKHGHKAAHETTAEYRAWCKIRERCCNPNDAAFSRYGGRGINICDRWLESYEAFYQDMGDKPSSDHSVDRIDNSKGYSPENCRWATRHEQANNKRNNKMLTAGGRQMTMAQWAREMRLKVGTIQSRLKCGWSEEDAVMRPVRVR